MSAPACQLSVFTVYPTVVLVSMKEVPFAGGLDVPDIREGWMAFIQFVDTQEPGNVRE